MSASPYRRFSFKTATNPLSWPPHSGSYYDWDTPTHDFYKESSSSSSQPPQSREEKELLDENKQGEEKWQSHYQRLTELEFSPTFATARQSLDYTYHHKLILNRQLLQDAIMERVVVGATAITEKSINNNNKTVTTRHWICFTAGPMGVGKGYVLTKLHQQGLFRLDQYIMIDPDMLKQELPEMPGFLQADRATAATKLHRESTQMSDILLEYALQNQRDVLVDGSLRDVDFYTDFFQRIRTEYPSYRLALIHVTADPAVIYRRAADRAIKTGRAVPTDLLEASIRQVPVSVSRLRHLAHAVHTIANNEGRPLELIESVVVGKNLGESNDENGHPKDNNDEKTTMKPTWEYFRRSWVDQMLEENRYEDKEEASTAATNEMTSIIVNMKNAFYCETSQSVASDLWKGAYPNFCPRCALSCDGQCGVCIHGRHLCACRMCNPCASQCD